MYTRYLSYCHSLRCYVCQNHIIKGLCLKPYDLTSANFIIFPALIVELITPLNTQGFQRGARDSVRASRHAPVVSFESNSSRVQSEQRQTVILAKLRKLAFLKNVEFCYFNLKHFTWTDTSRLFI